MRLYREDEQSTLHDLDSRIVTFAHEVYLRADEVDMHSFFVRNRNTLIGQYVYLLHEEALSSESCIDFIGFTEYGAVLLIEIKRGTDSRNRQEVISQIGKYAMDAFSVFTIVDDMAELKRRLSDREMQNEEIDERVLERIKTNVQQNNLNLYLVTEDATDELLASLYYLSFGKRNRKISVLEIKHYSVSGQLLCIVRSFNKQPLINSARKAEMSLEEKIRSITDLRLREEMERITANWIEMGFSIATRTVSTPEYFTFEWRRGQSAWVYYYVTAKQQGNLSGVISPLCQHS